MKLELRPKGKRFVCAISDGVVFLWLYAATLSYPPHIERVIRTTLKGIETAPDDPNLALFWIVSLAMAAIFTEHRQIVAKIKERNDKQP